MTTSIILPDTFAIANPVTPYSAANPKWNSLSSRTPGAWDEPNFLSADYIHYENFEDAEDKASYELTTNTDWATPYSGGVGMVAKYAPEGIQAGNHCFSELEMVIPINAVQVLVKFREYIPASYTSVRAGNHKTVGFWSGAYGIVNSNIAVTSECWPLNGNGYPSIYPGVDGFNHGHYRLPANEELPLWVAGDGQWHDITVLLTLAEYDGDYGRYRIWRDNVVIVDSDNPNWIAANPDFNTYSAREAIRYSYRGNFIDTIRICGWCNIGDDDTVPAFAGEMHFLYDDLRVYANASFKPIFGGE